MENHWRDNDGTLECEMKNGIPKTGEEKISYKSVYNGYWKCRDFELQHFWQRSVFLTAFLIACFAGYGGLIAAALECEMLSGLKLTFINGFGFAISLVGIILSLLWIMMAKGSKAWYERWEQAIDVFCTVYGEEAFECKDAANISGFCIENIKGFERPAMSGWLWRTDGGPYSPSRINIAIGHLALVIWSLIAAAHICIAKVGLQCVTKTGWLRSVFVEPSSMCATLVFVMLGFFWYVLRCLKSSTLES